MSDKDKQDKQEEQVEVEGHMGRLADEQPGDDDETPDVEGHKRNVASPPKRAPKRF